MAVDDGKETEFSTLACEGIWGLDLIFLLPGFSARWYCCVVSLSLFLWQFGVDHANQSINHT
jgi:hypothetical protein